MIALCPFSETLGQFLTKLLKKGLSNQHDWIRILKLGDTEYLVPASSDLKIKTLVAFLVFLIPLLVSVAMAYLFC